MAIRFEIENLIDRRGKKVQYKDKELRENVEELISIANTAVETAEGAVSTANEASEYVAGVEEYVDAKAEAAAGSAESAAADARVAETSASAAAGSAATAAESASSVSSYATSAESSAGSASDSAAAASQYASLAAQSSLFASQHAGTANQYKQQAEAWVTGAVSGTPVAQDAPQYNNNAQYYAQQASGSATAASTSETNASTAATTAAGKATDAEAWAVGQRNGSDAEDTDDTYHNNSKYYAEAAANVLESIPQDYSALSSDVTELKNDLATNINPFLSKWIIGYNISSSGSVGTNQYSAFTPMFYDAENTYTYDGASKDSNNKAFFVYIHEYDSTFTWLNRHSISMEELPATVTKESEDCRYFRFVFGRASSTSVVFTEADLDYFSMQQVERKAPMVPIQPNPVAVNTDGTINAMYSIAEDYLNYAYQGNKISGLIYISEKNASSASAYTPTVAPIQTASGVDQYSIQCSGFANLVLRAVSLTNSRYKTGTNGDNIPQPWGYKFDDGSSLRDGDYKDVVWSFNLLKYAEQHGFAYIVNEEGNNVRAGDLLFTVTPTSANYRGVTHVAVCLSCGADGKATVAEARDITRTSGGNEYAVGLVVNQIDLAGNTAVIYGARFPLGAVEQSAKVVYRQNPALSSTVSSGAIIGATHTIDMPQGLYTVVVRGSFTNTPVIKIRYTGTTGYVEVAPMQKSGDTYTLTIYADAPVQYVALHAPTGGTTCSGYNLFEVARGYIAPNTILEDYPELEYYDEIGYYLKNGVDLNDIGIGEYCASTNTIAASLLNCPTNMGFKMYCINRSRTTKMQIIINSNSVVYIRNSISSGWGAWYSFTGVEVAPN